MSIVLDKAPKPRSTEEQEKLWRSIAEYGNGTGLDVVDVRQGDGSIKSYPIAPKPEDVITALYPAEGDVCLFSACDPGCVGHYYRDASCLRCNACGDTHDG